MLGATAATGNNNDSTRVTINRGVFQASRVLSYVVSGHHVFAWWIFRNSVGATSLRRTRARRRYAVRREAPLGPGIHRQQVFETSGPGSVVCSPLELWPWELIVNRHKTTTCLEFWTSVDAAYQKCFLSYLASFRTTTLILQYSCLHRVNKKLSYRRETARQLRTFFSARSLIVHFTEHHFCCTTI